jgi:hypothetical protein
MTPSKLSKRFVFVLTVEIPPGRLVQTSEAIRDSLEGLTVDLEMKRV